MLKWTASAQKLCQDTPVSERKTINSNNITRTACLTEAKRRKRRATIANKENIPMLTSTPMMARTSNSPSVMLPLTDILNTTPETVANCTAESKRISLNTTSTKRRHSSVGFAMPQMPQYAITLPKYEEEYSPSTILPSGQQLALRGLLPDPFMGNLRYFTTPEVELESKKEAKQILSLPKKRKLEQEFVAIAQEEDIQQTENKKNFNNTGLMSNKMGDQTLDNLIDAILDSARKEEKKKKPRKSFNLRRRTLLKNQVEQNQNEEMLSPSYTAADDPCSDLNFLNCEPSRKCNEKKPVKPVSNILPAFEPNTPLMATPLNSNLLLQLPTPPPLAAVTQHDSFSLATPVRLNLKRRMPTKVCQNTSAKKYKVDASNYFEVGLALPSIYV